MRCSTHADLPAGWRCASCAKALCSGCTALGLLDVPVCAACGHAAEVLTEPRALAFPWDAQWPRAFDGLASPRAWGHLALLALVLQCLLSLGPWAWVLGRALEAGWIFLVVSRVAVELEPLELRAFGGISRACAGPGLRALAGVGLPLFGAAWLCGFGARSVPWSSLPAWGCAAWALLALPHAVAVAGAETKGRPAPWPWALPAWLREQGSAVLPLYAIAALAVGMEFLDGTRAPFSAGDMSLELSFVKAYVSRLFSVTALALLGCLAGRLAWTNAAVQVPRVREAPSGRYIPPARDPAEVEAERARRYAPLEFSPEALVDEGVVERAQRIAARGDYSGAAGLLWSVASAPAGPDSARALVVLARLHVERLQLADLGWSLYQRVVVEFPGTAAASFAQARLDEAGKAS